MIVNLHGLENGLAISEHDPRRWAQLHRRDEAR
jgi:hypothetical protein